MLSLSTTETKYNVWWSSLPLTLTLLTPAQECALHCPFPFYRYDCQVNDLPSLAAA